MGVKVLLFSFGERVVWRQVLQKARHRSGRWFGRGWGLVHKRRRRGCGSAEPRRERARALAPSQSNRFVNKSMGWEGAAGGRAHYFYAASKSSALRRCRAVGGRIKVHQSRGVTAAASRKIRSAKMLRYRVFIFRQGVRMGGVFGVFRQQVRFGSFCSCALCASLVIGMKAAVSGSSRPRSNRAK
jgi:hypothetical protein